MLAKRWNQEFFGFSFLEIGVATDSDGLLQLVIQCLLFHLHFGRLFEVNGRDVGLSHGWRGRSFVGRRTFPFVIGRRFAVPHVDFGVNGRMWNGLRR